MDLTLTSTKVSRQTKNCTLLNSNSFVLLTPLRQSSSLKSPKPWTSGITVWAILVKLPRETSSGRLKASNFRLVINYLSVNRVSLENTLASLILPHLHANRPHFSNLSTVTFVGPFLFSLPTANNISSPSLKTQQTFSKFFAWLVKPKQPNPLKLCVPTGRGRPERRFSASVSMGQGNSPVMNSSMS